MFPGQGPHPAIPHPDDAATFLVGWLGRTRRQDRPTFGYEIFLPHAIEDYARSVTNILPQHQVPGTWVDHLSEPFYVAAWDLCRLGILRPGTRVPNGQVNGDGDGYCLTPRGRTWLAEQDAEPFIPSNSGRTGNLLVAAGEGFGPVYCTRAKEASVCYAAGAYYACCAMVGAAAESIVLAVGRARLGEEKANKTYYAKNGRKQLEDVVLADVPSWLARDFRGHTGLIALWRDKSAHAHHAETTEGEAYMSLLGLLKFTHLIADNWSKLSAPITAT